jgi:hypothetical protein
MNMNKIDQKGSISGLEMKKELSREFRELPDTLKARFEKNMDHHMEIEWPKVQAKVEGTNE